MAIKQEPTDWSGSSPQQQQHHDNSSLQNRGNLSPKQPLDFKIPLGNANVKLETEISNSHSDANAENATTSNYVVNSGFDNYNNNMHCDVCKKSFDEPKLWLRHMETHTAQASSSTTSVITPARNALMPAENDMDNISKSYVPKKRRRISVRNVGILFL